MHADAMTTPPLPKPTPVAPPVATAARRTSEPVRIDSTQLFAGAVEVQIDHFGAVYRLKQTALGKLILTK
jgi:hemin uptake protein HemP